MANDRGVESRVSAERITALQNLAKFCDEYEKMRGLDPDLVYGLHRGDPSECEITIRDLRAVAAGVADLESAQKRAEEERDWWRDAISGLQALIDSHYLLPHNVTADARLRQIQTELRDMGVAWESWDKTENDRLATRVEELETVARELLTQIGKVRYDPTIRERARVVLGDDE